MTESKVDSILEQLKSITLLEAVSLISKILWFCNFLIFYIY